MTFPFRQCILQYVERCSNESKTISFKVNINANHFVCKKDELKVVTYDLFIFLDHFIYLKTLKSSYV